MPHPCQNGRGPTGNQGAQGHMPPDPAQGKEPQVRPGTAPPRSSSGRWREYVTSLLPVSLVQPRSASQGFHEPEIPRSGQRRES